MRLGRGHSCILAQGQLVIRLTDPHTGWQVKWDINEISSLLSWRHEGGEVALNERKRAIWLPKNILLFWVKRTKYKYCRIQCGSGTHAGLSACMLCKVQKSKKFKYFSFSCPNRTSSWNVCVDWKTHWSVLQPEGLTSISYICLVWKFKRPTRHAHWPL